MSFKGGVALSEYILEMKDICKRFPGVLALDSVDFSVKPGEVHCLIGANGAGKSTLMKILAGVYTKDEGSVEFDGKRLEHVNTLDVKRAGIAVIYQELSLVDGLSVGENVFLNNFPRKHGTIDWATVFSRTEELAKELNQKIDVKAPVRSLSIGQRQLVELMKCLNSNAKLIVMDEPSATLSQEEFNTLVKAIHDLKKRGIAVVYISHRLEELYMVGDRLTVLRDGIHVMTDEISNVTMDELVEAMIGRKVEVLKKDSTDTSRTDEVVLEVSNLSTRKLKDISLKLHKGEILGLYGLVGSGRTEILRAVYGIDPIQSGEIKINNVGVKIKSPRQAIAKSIGLLPENRKTQGLVLGLPVWENMTMVSLRKFLKRLSIQFGKLYKECNDYVGELSIKTPTVHTMTRNLSGGNQQKVIFSKWLSSGAEILLVDEPTQGIDIGAKDEIYKILKRMAADGNSVIIVSSELSELIQVCDSIEVMFHGRRVARFDGDDIEENAILKYAIAGGAQ